MNNIWDFGENFFDGGLLFFIIKAIVLFLIAKLIVSLINKGINKTIEINKAQETSLRFLANIIKVAIYGICLFIMLGDITPLKGIGTAVLGATSIISVVVGLAAQESLGNFLAGFFLAMNHPFKVGDIIRIVDRDITGIVKEITFRHTIIMTFDDTKMIIPNSVMNTAIIEDKEYGQGKVTKWLTIDVAYGSDVELASKLILESAALVSEIMDTRNKKEKEEGAPLFNVSVTDFTKNGITLLFPVKVKKLADQTAAISKIRKEILKKFKKHNIKIASDRVEIIK